MYTDEPPRGKRLTREATRERIVAKADELFRHYGFGKTTVADMAAELGMSTANIYKFFPSKDAIIEATCDRNLRALKASFDELAGAEKPALDRMEDVTLAVFWANQAIFRTEKQIYRLVSTATENNWACVQEFHASLRRVMTKLVAEGMARGEFQEGDAQAIAQLLLDLLTPALNPLLLRDEALQMSESKVRAHVRFLGQALQP